MSGGRGARTRRNEANLIMGRTGQWAQLRVRRPPTPARDPRHPPIPGLKVPSRTPRRATWMSGLGSLLLHIAVAIVVIANLRKRNRR